MDIIEMHIIEIVRFASCMIAAVAGILLMVKADDNDWMRRLSVILAALLVYFNKKVGVAVYLLLGSVFETLFAAMGVTFIVILAVSIMLLPLIGLVVWIIRSFR